MSSVAKNIGASFSVWEACGYASGFHVSFARADDAHNIVLICPNCGQRYTVNWTVRL